MTGACVRDQTALAAAGLLASTRKSYNRAKSESALLVHFSSISVAPVTDLSVLRLSASGLYSLMVDNLSGCHIVVASSVRRYAPPPHAESACLITQPRERSSLAAIWSTLSAIGNGTCAVITFVACAVLFFICISD